jgi:predicted ABC-type ATPase
MSTAKEFQETGYEVHLIFMGLNSLEESIQRVATRVKTGGHKVSEESIRYNFEQGHKNLYNHFNEFTTVTLFNNAIAGTDEETEPVEILFIADGKLHLHTMNYPDWSKPLVDGFDQDHISYAAEG